ncbi:KamA family radical SAM protein, partial [bacterium]|nr:KamA family radical SAM protein [bacterium]
MHNPKYVTHLENVQGIKSNELTELNKVMKEFAFRANEYYLSLIDWNNPDDPIRRLIVPHMDELDDWGELDASSESDYTKVPGLQHKYRSTALLLTTNVCGGFCRYCFRKRLFLSENDETIRDFGPDLDYLRKHSEINNVLLTGGDPLMLSTARLRNLIEKLREIDHIKIIRIGSKLPAFNPYRILNDPDLLALIHQFSTPEKRIYIMAHFTHPRELTDVAIAALDALRKANAEIVNQCPIIHGVNDSPEVLSELFNKLSYLGVPPYYIFQCRPTLGNKA